MPPKQIHSILQARPSSVRHAAVSQEIGRTSKQIIPVNQTLQSQAFSRTTRSSVQGSWPYKLKIIHMMKAKIKHTLLPLHENSNSNSNYYIQTYTLLSITSVPCGPTLFFLIVREYGGIPLRFKE